MLYQDKDNMKEYLYTLNHQFNIKTSFSKNHINKIYALHAFEFCALFLISNIILAKCPTVENGVIFIVVNLLNFLISSCIFFRLKEKPIKKEKEKLNQIKSWLTENKQHEEIRKLELISKYNYNFSNYSLTDIEKFLSSLDEKEVVCWMESVMFELITSEEKLGEFLEQNNTLINLSAEELKGKIHEKIKNQIKDVISLEKQKKESLVIKQIIKEIEKEENDKKLSLSL